MSELYDIPVKTLDGKMTTLREYAGKTLLIVNTASKCGYTPQYDGLNALYKKYRDKGLVVLGFPCNQFLGQEPGNEQEIAAFCELNYKIEFPMFAKVNVNGPSTHPLFAWLKRQAPGFLGIRTIRWNFTKFLVSPDGMTVKRYVTKVTPEQIEPELVRKLAA